MTEEHETVRRQAARIAAKAAIVAAAGGVSLLNFSSASLAAIAVLGDSSPLDLAVSLVIDEASGPSGHILAGFQSKSPRGHKSRYEMRC